MTLDLTSILHNDKVRNGLRIGLGLLIFGLILIYTPINEIIITLRTIVWQYVAIAFVLNIITGLVLAYRCYVLFDVYPGSKPSYFDVVKISFSGMLFNQILPSSVGGDIYRVAAMARLEGGTAGAFSVVFLDRMTGLLGLLITGLLALIIGARSMGLPVQASLWAAAALIALVGFLQSVIHPKSHQIFSKYAGRLPKSSLLTGVVERIENLFMHLSLYHKRYGILIYTVVLSVILRCIWVWGAYFIGKGLHLSISYLVYLGGLSVVELIRSIPITIQGFGVREGVFSIIFTRYGISPAQALTLATMIYALYSLNNIVGGALYFWPTDMGKTAGKN